MPKAVAHGVNWLKLVASILACQIIGGIGTIFTIPALPIWYASLSKPFFNPPSWLFGPVWLTLYTLIGIALYVLWEKWPSTRRSIRDFALYAFIAQLALNPVWSFLFFGLRSPIYGLIGIAALWVAILATIVGLYRMSRNAALALLPYIFWVSFAAVLNLSIVLLNAGI